MFLSGVQALARLPLEQMRADRRRGLRTAAFVSGYPGSPLAGFDKEAEAAIRMAGDLPYVHTPALNEELAATAVMGSQLAAERPTASYDGISGLLVRQDAGRRPGQRRAAPRDLRRRASQLRRGGVRRRRRRGQVVDAAELVRRARLIGLHMPILTPGDVQDALDLGRHGVAMSRASGLWSAAEDRRPVADGTGTIDLDLDRVQPVLPHDGRRRAAVRRRTPTAAC